MIFILFILFDILKSDNLKTIAIIAKAKSKIVTFDKSLVAISSNLESKKNVEGSKEDSSKRKRGGKSSHILKE